ncbi:MAG: hypothetical protein ACTS3T_18185 [Almyronema sp.]
MEYWEFLLQKEGDRTWLPLESAEVEILEGRYRLMAHGSQANATVEVRISQLLLEEIPPKRRVLKRQGKTNQDGLMVVMPFTQLHAGTWEIRCMGGDPLNDLMGDSWQHNIQFQVLPPSSDEIDDWEADWSPVANQETVAADKVIASSEPLALTDMLAAHAATEASFDLVVTASSDNSSMAEQAAQAADTLTTSSATDISDLEKMAEQLMGDVFSDMLTPAEPPETPQPIAPLASPSANHPLPFQISLDQPTYLVRARQPLTLQICIQASQTDAFSELPPSELKLVLRNPQTSAVLDTIQRSLSVQPLPTDLTVEVKLSAALKTHLILAELTLQAAEGSIILANQAFTIAAMLDNLLETVADQGEYLQDPDQWHLPLETPLSAAQETAPDETSVAEPQKVKAPVRLPSAVTKNSKPLFLPAMGMFLPPQIYDPLVEDPETAISHSPVLPSLPLIAPQGELAVSSEVAPSVEPLIDTVDQSISTVEFEPAVSSALDSTVPDADLPEADLAAAPSEQMETVTVDEADADADLIAEAEQIEFAAEASLDLAIEDESSESESSLVDVAFQSLNLQDRFWSRLSAFALDGHKAAQEVQSAIEATEAALATDDEAVPPPVEAEPISFSLETGSPHEFVVYDAAEPAAPSSERSLGADHRSEASKLAELPPVPVPRLKVPTGHLIAGELVSIEVTLPVTPERLCVKFWTSDLQTRALVDNPRWLMSFDPDGQGYMSTTLRLPAPQGCLEARFAAIAVDVVSQRESERVTVDRSILPANLIDTSLDEFDV